LTSGNELRYNTDPQCKELGKLGGKNTRTITFKSTCEASTITKAGSRQTQNTKAKEKNGLTIVVLYIHTGSRLIIRRVIELQENDEKAHDVKKSERETDRQLAQWLEESNNGRISQENDRKSR